METRQLANAVVPPVGLGCMNLSHAYGDPAPPAVAQKVIERAFELGVVHFDTAPLYGGGRNEELLGPMLRNRRERVFLASKCGMMLVDGKKTIDGRPSTLRRTIEASLRRLGTDYLDLCYLHRRDFDVPVEESIGAIAEFVDRGAVRAIGISEMSASTLIKAHGVHPIAAVQSEYSLWTRNPEIAVLDACRAIGAQFVAYAPLARGFLAQPGLSPDQFGTNDIRGAMPRFKPEHFPHNEALVRQYREIAEASGCTPAQLALAWVLSRGPHVHVIPGTTNARHLEENMATLELTPAPGALEEVGCLINQRTVSGPRYTDAQQREIDTENFHENDRREAG